MRVSGPRTVAACVLVLAALAVAGCGAGAGGQTQPAAEATPEGASLESARAAFDAAGRALVARDRGAYRAALPTRGADAAEAIGDFYRTLARLPWTSFRFVVTAVPGHDGRFLVKASGSLTGAGPHDRLAGERVVDVELRGGSMVVVGDETPPLVRRQYLMAFNHPVVSRHSGLVVLSERKAGAWRSAVVEASAGARERLRRLGLTTGGGVLVTVYSSRRQVKAAFADGMSEERMRFFAHTTPRVGLAEWRRYDIAVVGSSLPRDRGSVERLLAHEWTHALTVGWFLQTVHAPTFLLEGLAEVVDGEGEGDYAALRRELATGNQRWPLVDALGTSSLWADRDYDEILLVYTMAESLVRYVRDTWGARAVKPFCVAVANADLTEAGLGGATQEALGVGWGRFTAGWKQYVLAGR